MKLYEWAQENGLTNEAVRSALMSLKSLPKRPPAIMNLLPEDQLLLEIEFASRTPPSEWHKAATASQPAKPRTKARPAASRPQAVVERTSASRYAVSSAQFGTEEFDAVDESDAVSQFVKAKRVDAHRHQFQVTKLTTDL